MLGELASRVDWLWWLSYAQEFGLSSPLTIDVKVLRISFSCMFKINVASIIGMGVALFWYRKV